MSEISYRATACCGWHLPEAWVCFQRLLGVLLRLVFCGAVAVPAAATAAPARPNIVYILADDLGYTDIACNGSRYYETPNIDALASQGLRLTRYYQCPNCQPTRASLLSGQYGPRTGVYTVGNIDRFDWWKRPMRPVDNAVKLPLDRVTFAESLRKAGYATALFGKWHLGSDPEHHPSRRGFDEAIVSMGRHFRFTTTPAVEHPEGQHLADFLTDRAVDFMRRHRDGPFLLYLPHFAVHSPHEAKPELVARFRNKPPVGGHRDPVYAALIASVDESVGRVMRVLDELGIADNTVVIFSSDNGGVGGYLREGLKTAGDVTDNAPLRSGKGSLYEGGIRAPLIVRWPGVTKPGASSDVPAAHVDLYPTFLELAGAVAPAQPLDGESLVPVFRDPGAKLRRDAVFHHFPGYLGAGPNAWRTTPAGAIHSGDWKLIEFFEDGRLELYNLRDDVGETRNLAVVHPEKARGLRDRLAGWRKEIGARLPTPHTPGVKPADFGARGSETD